MPPADFVGMTLCRGARVGIPSESCPYYLTIGKICPAEFVAERTSRLLIWTENEFLSIVGPRGGWADSTVNRNAWTVVIWQAVGVRNRAASDVQTKQTV